MSSRNVTSQRMTANLSWSPPENTRQNYERYMAERILHYDSSTPSNSVTELPRFTQNPHGQHNRNGSDPAAENDESDVAILADVNDLLCAPGRTNIPVLCPDREGTATWFRHDSSARVQLGSMHYRAKKSLFDGYIKMWTDEKTKEIAAQYFVNRGSKRGGLGVAKHNNGAKTYERRWDELATELGREPNMIHFMEQTHLDKKTRTISDMKTKQFLDMASSQVELIQSQCQHDGDPSAQPDPLTT